MFGAGRRRADGVVTDAAPYLTRLEMSEVDLRLSASEREFLRSAGCFRPEGLAALAELCAEKPSADFVMVAGEPPGREALAALRLGPLSGVGAVFADHVRDGCGPEAVAAIRALYTRRPVQRRGLMLRVLGERLRDEGIQA